MVSRYYVFDEYNCGEIKNFSKLEDALDYIGKEISDPDSPEEMMLIKGEELKFTIATKAYLK